MAAYPPPNVTRPDFGGAFAPPDVQAAITALVVSGSVLASRLTRLPTNRGVVTFPTASPDNAAWLGELDQIPAVDLHDSKYEVAVAKLAGLVPVSNEALSDAQFPLSTLIGQLVQDSVSADMDAGLFNGTGVAPQPTGLLTVAPAAAAGTDLRAASIVVWGEMTANGAAASDITVFAHPPLVATEWAREADTAGVPIHADATGPDLTLGPAIRLVPSAVLAADQAIAVETTRTYFVERDAIAVAASEHMLFDYDGVVLRVRGRVAVACPNPQRSLRKLTIVPPVVMAASTSSKKASS